MKKRLALMTWHHVENYGTFFQAYALKSVLEKMDCYVILIDYRRHGNTLYRQNLFIRYSKAIVSKVKDLIKGRKDVFQFTPECFGNCWSKYFSYTDRCRSNEDLALLNGKYDIFLCGSDQIWGPEWLDGHFLLDFVENPNQMIAYAPSIGVDCIEDSKTAEIMARLITRFDYQKLSLREITGCKLAETLTNRHGIFNALDPVLLAGRKCMSQLIDLDFVTPKESYSLIFFLKNHPANIEDAIIDSKSNGTSPKVMHCTQSEDTPYANLDELTPGQLLSYIKDAKHIYTDSYHILILSILFNIKTKVYEKKDRLSKNNRISDLYKILNIDKDSDKIEWRAVEKRIDELRKKSNKFLVNALNITL